MSDELKELAEQVLADLSPRYQPHIGYDDLPPKAMRVARLAEGVLAVNPADSDVAIDEDWLELVTTKRQWTPCHRFDIGDITLHRRCQMTGTGEWVLNLRGYEAMQSNHPHTRGQLRSLCRALGIELKEKP